MQWTNALILEFLHYLEQEPGIWNPRHHTYKDRVELGKAWTRIQSNLSVNVAVFELKRKRESLMATFRSITSKMKSNTGTSDDSYRTNWFAYETMVGFLGDLYQAKIKDDTLDPNDEIIKLELHDMIKDDSNASVGEDLYDDDADAAVSVTSKTSNTDVLPPFRPPTHERQSRKRKDVVCVCELKNRDECSLYTQLLAKKLRAFDEHSRELIMHRIDNFVFRAKRKRTSSDVSASSASFPDHSSYE